MLVVLWTVMFHTHSRSLWRVVVHCHRFLTRLTPFHSKVSPIISTVLTGLLEGLSVCEDVSLEELYKKHTSSVLEALQGTTANWTLHSPHRFAFEAIVTHAGVYHISCNTYYGIFLLSIIWCVDCFSVQEMHLDWIWTQLLKYSELFYNKKMILNCYWKCWWQLHTSCRIVKLLSVLLMIPRLLSIFFSLVSMTLNLSMYFVQPFNVFVIC